MTRFEVALTVVVVVVVCDDDRGDEDPVATDDILLIILKGPGAASTLYIELFTTRQQTATI